MVHLPASEAIGCGFLADKPASDRHVKGATKPRLTIYQGMDEGMRTEAAQWPIWIQVM